MTTKPAPLPSKPEKPAESSARFDRFLTAFRSKALINLSRTWKDIAANTRQMLKNELNPDLSGKDDIKLIRRHMEDCVVAKGGEVSARARTVSLGQIYLNLSDAGKACFLKILGEYFAVDKTTLDKAIMAYQKASEAPAVSKAQQAIRDALLPPRIRILRQFNSLPNGFKFLVDMRADVLKNAKGDHHLEALEDDMRQLLTAWFDIGLLDLEQITWRSPAALLEKLIAYEAVHEIRSWDDLKNRLDSDRRCYAFFHSKMPLEPLIFVEVALLEGLADNVQKLLDETSPLGDPAKADTAIFYSISNAQQGLAGISFGNFLIKRVVERLSHELPNVKTFATLSPVPGFRAWLDGQLTRKATTLFTTEERQLLQEALSSSSALETDLKTALTGAWAESSSLAAALQPWLVRQCATYLAKEKKGNRALDAVAHFHLSNGARLERINWLADTSAKGFKQSYGIMVNYLYKLGDIDENHEAYTASGTVNHSRALAGLLKA